MRLKTLLRIGVTALCIFFSVPASQAEETAYAVSIEGVEDSALLSTLQNRSLLYTLQDKRPASASGLERRIKSDIKVLKTVLEEHGYFGASVDYDLEKTESGYAVMLAIAPGPLYAIGAFTVSWAGDEQPDLESPLPAPADGHPALPEEILEAEQGVFNTLLANSYPAPAAKERILVVDHEKKRVDIALTVAPGPRAHFGVTRIEGLETLEEDFVRRRIAWEEGDLFDIAKTARTRRSLNGTGLFSGVDIRYDAPEPDEGGNAMPVTVQVKEGKHRSIGAGLAWSTTQALLAQLFWEHRNLLGEAEHLRLRAEGGTISYGLSADLSKPDLWGMKALSGQIGAQYKTEEQEAYNKEAVSLSTGLNYTLSPESSVVGSVVFERSRLEEPDGTDENLFTLMSFPLSFRYDDTGDLLNPRKGKRLLTVVTPYDVVGEKEDFLKTDVTLSHYLPFGGKFVWANRARAAALWGQSLNDIPEDKRLFAGGGGSVRSHGYQLIGPLDADDNPTGGRLLFELGTEGRYMFTEDIEGVAFVGGGRVTEEIALSSNADFLWGGGIGARYHTAVGPLRLDVAVPFDRRKVDNAFQFYISIGQAF